MSKNSVLSGSQGRRASWPPAVPASQRFGLQFFPCRLPAPPANSPYGVRTMRVEHHDLDHEFPKLHDVMQELTKQNDRFRAMFSEYHNLTDEIERLEEADLPVGDFTIEDMKKKRVRLKDQIYHMAIGFQAGRPPA
jgi:uncharacterized protein YdcH (DUF465 family)